MNNLTRVTLTGVDEQTPTDQIIAISNEFPMVEWGLLYSPKVADGAHPGAAGVAGKRYPSVATLARLLRTLPGEIQLAIHVCGKGVGDLLNGEPIVSGLLKQASARQTPARIQLNFNQPRAQIDLNLLARFMDQHAGTNFIIQHNAANETVWEHLKEVPNFNVLFDASGGKGIKCTNWLAPLPGISCGYAGGLGADNLRLSMQEIVKASGGQPFWVDMEGKLRDANDQFDTQAAKACLEEACAGYLLATMSAQEIRDADRFCLICDDDEGYDIPRVRMKRLEQLGLVVDKKFGRFQQTSLLLSIKDDLTHAAAQLDRKRSPGFSL